MNFTGKSNKGLHIISHSDPNVLTLTDPTLDVSRLDITAYYEENNTNNPEMFALKGQNALGSRFFTSFQTDMIDMNNIFSFLFVILILYFLYHIFHKKQKK